jgi:hypothetical protein
VWTKSRFSDIFNLVPKRGRNHSIRILYTVKVKVKVKFNLEQAAKAQRGSRGIALLFL